MSNAMSARLASAIRPKTTRKMPSGRAEMGLNQNRFQTAHWVHGFTSRGVSTRIVATTRGLVGLIGSTADGFPGGGVGRIW